MSTRNTINSNFYQIVDVDANGAPTTIKSEYIANVPAPNPAGSNTEVQFNDEGVLGASNTFTFNNTTNTLSVTNYVGNGTGLTNIVGANVVGVVANSTYSVTAGTAGTVTTNAQPNITSVGVLNQLVVNGTTNLGSVNNVTITGGSSGYIMTTDGAGGLSWTAGGGAGTSGYSGYSGYSGAQGTSGYSGTNGSAGASGISGYSGTNGTNGDSGISGYSGQDGIAGASGVSGFSGIDGINGDSGISGYSGETGASGVSGFSGAPGPATPGGANTEVQYNDNGSLNASNTFTFNNTTNTVTIANLTVNDGVVTDPSLKVTPAGTTVGTIGTVNSALSVITEYGDSANLTSAHPVAFMRSRGNATTLAASSNNDMVMALQGYVYNGNNYSRAVSISATAPNAANTTQNAWTAGNFFLETGNPGGNFSASTNASQRNLINYTPTGDLFLLQGSPGTTYGGILFRNYGGNANNSATAQYFTFDRARGNRDSNVALQNGDQLGAIRFRGYNGNAFFTTRNAGIFATANTTYGAIANGSSIPTDLSFLTCSNTTQYTTYMRGDGSWSMPGNLSVGGYGIFNSPANDTDTLKLVSNNKTNMNLIRLERYGDTANLGGVGTFNMYRTGGTQASPAAVANGDVIYNLTTSVYGDSGNIFVDTGGFSINVDTNYGNGNVTTNATYAQGGYPGTLNFNYDTINFNGISNLGSNANVKITGGSSGDVLSTDGSGNLSWQPQSGGGGAETFNVFLLAGM